MEGTRKPRWLRFTIRDVLWLTIVVALALCWWLHQRQLSAEIVSLRGDISWYRSVMEVEGLSLDPNADILRATSPHGDVYSAGDSK
jgi:hypothetical protein